MAKKKNPQTQPAPESTNPPPKPGEGASAPDRHKFTVVSFRPPDVLLSRLRALASSERRSLAQQIMTLLEEALDARDAQGAN